MRSAVSIVKRPSRHLTRSVLAAGAISVFIHGCSSGPPLMVWHNEQLTEEFTAQKKDEVRTLDDYRKLEDRLFAQLDEKVYTPTETGPEYALLRYSVGSAADPRENQPDWNRSFELIADSPVGGVLLLHGMSDSPYSLRVLGETLNQRGYWVVGLRLPGHGTAPSGLKHVTSHDMAAATRLGMEHLAAKLGSKPIHIVGYSTGAALALSFTLDALEGTAAPLPASLVLISPAIRVHRSAALASFKHRLAVLPGLEGLAWLQVLPEFDPYKYNSFATNAGDVVYRITRSLDRRIAAWVRSNPAPVLPPILAFKSTVDATVTTDAVVDGLLELLAPHRHELVLFDINRLAAKSALLVSDPGPLTTRLMGDETLPFTLTLVTNQNPNSARVVVLRKAPFAVEPAEPELLDLAWPPGVISLSHVALPIPPDDPLYGQRPPSNQDILFLGQMAIQGERGLLKLPSDWLLRMRHNPFYDFLEKRVIDWFDDVSR